jgi:hypothetical protein
MASRGSHHQHFCVNRFMAECCFEIIRPMLEKVLGKIGLNLEGFRFAGQPYTDFRGSSGLSAKGGVAVVCGDCKRVDRNWVAFVEPQKNGGQELRFGCRLLCNKERFGNHVHRHTNFVPFASSRIGNKVSTWPSATLTRKFFERSKRLRTRTASRRLTNFSPLLSFASNYARPKNDSQRTKRPTNNAALCAVLVLWFSGPLPEAFDQLQFSKQDSIKVPLTQWFGSGIGVSANYAPSFKVFGDIVFPLHNGRFERQILQVSPISREALSPAVEKLKESGNTGGKNSRHDSNSPYEFVKNGRIDVHALYWFGFKVAVICGVSAGTIMGLLLLLTRS